MSTVEDIVGWLWTPSIITPNLAFTHALDSYYPGNLEERHFLFEASISSTWNGAQSLSGTWPWWVKKVPHPNVQPSTWLGANTQNRRLFDLWSQDPFRASCGWNGRKFWSPRSTDALPPLSHGGTLKQKQTKSGMMPIKNLTIYHIHLLSIHRIIWLLHELIKAFSPLQN